MARAVGMMGGCGSPSSGSSLIQLRKNSKTKRKNDGFRVCCVSSSALTDPYRTLRIQPGASKSEVKRAFKQLALQYHPDVCRGSDCGIQFSQINEAYDIVMSNLRGDSTTSEMEVYDAGIDEPLRGMNDLDWDMGEEWMGSEVPWMFWEGAGIRDYSSHINPYI